MDLTLLLTPTINVLHDGCLNITQKSALPDIHAALLCGKRLEPSNFKDQLASFGLIHLVVVSGAHLLMFDQILDRIFSFFKLPRFLIWIALVLYALTCQLSPPVTRALIHKMTKEVGKHRFALLKSGQAHFVSGMLCLCLFPLWISSLSFQLSWLASLALSWRFKDPHPVKQALLIYILLFPLLAQIQLPSPIHILSNLTLAPLIASLSLPLSLLSTFIPHLSFFDELFWGFIQGILEWLEKLSPKTGAQWNWSPLWIWIYLWFFQSFALFNEIQMRRLKFRKPS